jgi:DNA-binding IclR family transcriptional regulator
MKQPVQAKREGVDAVARALQILKVFREAHDALNLTDLARETGLYKSTTLRLAASLEQAGFLIRGRDRAFRPGPELNRLGRLYREPPDISGLLRPVLGELVAATSETASFYVQEGAERVCRYRENSPRPVRHHLEEGARFPIRLGAAGRVLLAFSEVKSGQEPEVRRAGYCVSLGERDPEVGAAAVPVFNSAGDLRGALTVSALITRFDIEAQTRALTALRQAAARLSVVLSPG